MWLSFLKMKMNLKRFGHQKIFVFLSLVLILFIYLTRSKDLPLFPPKTDKPLVVVCNDTVSRAPGKLSKDLPVIYFITPTYPRREQYAELTRLGQTLMSVPNLVWIIAEDTHTCSKLVTNIVRKFSIPYVHLVSPMPSIYFKAFYKPRGVSSRNAGLDWIASNIASHDNSHQAGGVVYFADDDNTYDLRLFEEIRSTRRVSMFPVGLISKQGLSSPIVQRGKVIGFTDPWFANRKFPVDMAGFAFNINLFRQFPSARMPYKAGHEEDLFLKELKIELEDIEPLANDCTEVLVWHTQAVKEKKPEIYLGDDIQHRQSSLKGLIEDLEYKGIMQISKNGRELSTCFEKKCP